MLLVSDMGNTNTVVGVYRQEDLIAHMRLAPRRNQTSDEHGVLINDSKMLGSSMASSGRVHLKPRASHLQG